MTGEHEEHHDKTDDEVIVDGGDRDDDWDERKVFVSRIPPLFDASSVKRLLEEELGGGEGTVVDVSLVAKTSDDGDENTTQKDDANNEHRGFAFVTLRDSALQQRAVELGSIRGGAKATSTKKFTLYIKPVVRDDDQEKQVCFLYNKFRCPYGDECKFLHQGEGGCIDMNKAGGGVSSKKKKKCFAFKKGKCKLGDTCPHSHDFEVKQSQEGITNESRPDSEKDCINWKQKGKCRKGDKCPYRHDPDNQKKRKRPEDGDVDTDKKTKNQQPLSIRVYGLNYETTEKDVREFFQHCGKIVEITFPLFEDSGRSKGYCGILFQSPKAATKAVQELDGKELHGRWLRVQAGKMYLKQWEEHHARPSDPAQKGEANEGSLVGEFGQKVKRRKKHGHKE